MAQDGGRGPAKRDSATTVKVVEVGPNPESIGGISSHVNSLSSGLKHRGYEVVNVYGPRRSGLSAVFEIPQYLSDLQEASDHARLIHFHGSRWGKLALGGFAPRVVGGSAAASQRLVLSIHSASFYSGPPYRKYLDSLTSVFGRVLVMSEGVRSQLAEYLSPINHAKVVACSPFVPARPRQSPRSNVARPIICSGLWSALYGFDDVIDAVAIVRAAGIETELHLAVSTAGMNQLYREQVLARTSDLEWVRVRENTNVSLALAHEEWACLVRATSSDSFGLSVHEALWAGIPAIATPVGVRPRGTQIFGVGDAGAAAKCILRVFADPGAVADEVSGADLRSGLDETVEAFNSLVGG